MLKNKKNRDNKKKLIKEDIRYVIYCRKSRDESGDTQKQSLLDQLKRCLDYAKQKGIKIAHHSELTDEFFRGDEYHRWIAECQSPHEKDVLERANGLFYIVEQKSAKSPNNRPQWTKLIDLVKRGKINGILSYTPDRHARNLVESGELVQLIDQQYLDVQYTNFTFENNENGRMILGINFVISYNYSDNLSKVTKRGKTGVIERGQADGKYKYGYFINEHKYHEPDPDYFEARQEAFKRKTYNNETDEEIRKYIVSKGFKRKYKKNKKIANLNKKVLYKIWLDPFYYGKLISGDNEVDLRDGSNPYYKPLITEEEHLILLDRHIKANPTSLRAYKTKDEYDEIMPFPNKFIQYDGTHGLSFNLPNKARFLRKLTDMQVRKPDATLKDVIELHQISYKNGKVKIDGKQLNIDGATLTNTVYNYLKQCFRVNESNYEQYREYQMNEYENTMRKMNEQRRILQNKINQTTHLMDSHVRNFMKLRDPDTYQKEIYQRDFTSYKDQIEYSEGELKKLGTQQRNIMLELDGFVQFFEKVAMIYDKANNVRKRKITSLLFSNIIITSEKQVKFKPKPGLEGLFIQTNQDSETRTRDLKTPSLAL